MNIFALAPRSRKSNFMQESLSLLKHPLNLPILTREQERELLYQIHQNHDVEAAKQLVLHHLKFVLKLAYSFEGYGLALNDLMQEGTLGLMKAIRSYDLKFDVRLSTFATQWVKAEMFNFVLKNWRIVKIATTKKQRKLFFQFNRLQAQLQNPDPFSLEKKGENGGPITHEFSREEIEEMGQRVQGQDHALYSGENLSLSEASKNYALALEDHHSNFSEIMAKEEWHQKTQEALKEKMSALDARSLSIIKARFQESPRKSLREIAQNHQLSIERVRQLENQALKKLKGALKKED